MSSDSLGSLELTVLIAVARLKDEAFGLAVRRDVSDRTGREYSVGAIYTTLQRLEDKGFLASRATDPLPVRGGRSRRQFVMTAAGQKALRHAQQVATSVWSGVRASLRPTIA